MESENPTDNQLLGISDERARELQSIVLGECYLRVSKSYATKATINMKDMTKFLRPYVTTIEEGLYVGTLWGTFYIEVTLITGVEEFYHILHPFVGDVNTLEDTKKGVLKYIDTQLDDKNEGFKDSNIY